MWFSILKKEQPHHEGRVYSDPKKLGRELTQKEIDTNGEIFLLNAIKSTPNVKKKGNMVIVQPDWLKSYQPKMGEFGQLFEEGDRVHGFVFDFNQIHTDFCIRHYYNRASLKTELVDLELPVFDTKREKNYLSRDTCIRQDYDSRATSADFFVTFVSLSNHKESFLSLWQSDSEGRALPTKSNDWDEDYRRNKDRTITKLNKKRDASWYALDEEQRKKYRKKNPEVDEKGFYWVEEKTV